MPYMPYFGVLSQGSVTYGSSWSFVSEETENPSIANTWSCSSCTSESDAFLLISSEHPASAYPVGTQGCVFDGIGIWWVYIAV